MGIETGKLHDLVQKVITYRANWFKNTPSSQEIQKVIKQLHGALEELLIDLLSEKTFYLPSTKSYTIASNLNIINSEKFNIERKGFSLPYVIPVPERKFFNLLHRLNYFTVNVPYSKPPNESVLQQRFDLLSAMRKYNRQFLPHFLIPASSFKFI